MKKNLIKMLAIFANVLIILAMTIILFMFMNKPNYTKKEMYAADVIKQGLQDYLRVPESLRIYGDEMYLIYFPTLDLDIVCLEYDSKTIYDVHHEPKISEVSGSQKTFYTSYDNGHHYYLDYITHVQKLLLFDDEIVSDTVIANRIDAENVAKILGVEYMG